MKYVHKLSDVSVLDFLTGGCWQKGGSRPFPKRLLIGPVHCDTVHSFAKLKKTTSLLNNNNEIIYKHRKKNEEMLDPYESIWYLHYITLIMLRPVKHCRQKKTRTHVHILYIYELIYRLCIPCVNTLTW